MNVSIFNKKYTVRRFGEQKNVKGYLTSSYSDMQFSLNIHPMGSDELQALPEGERKVKRLEGHGSDILVTADEKLNRKGDLLYYHDNWYECTSAQLWDHTMLSHYNYQFVLVPTDAAGTPDTAPPLTDLAHAITDENGNLLVDEENSALFDLN